MLINRSVIVVIIVALMGTACGNTNLVPIAESQDTQSDTITISPSANSVPSGGARLEGCESLSTDIPLIDSAFEVSEYRGWCTYRANIDYQSAIDFYKVQLSANGWNKFRITESVQDLTLHTYFYYEKSNRKLAIGVISIGSPAKVIVTIYPNHWIFQPCDNGDVGLPIPDDISIIGNMIGFCQEQYGWSDTGEGHYIYDYDTLESFNDVVQFYRTEALNNGWSLDWDNVDVSLVSLKFNKPGRMGTVQSGLNNFVQAPLDVMKVAISVTKEYGDTHVIIFVSDGQ